MRAKGSNNRVAHCPLCSYTTKLLSSFERHLDNTHATTSQSLWENVHGCRPTCSCGCGKATKWLNWHDGYSLELRGHWQTNRTKENDERIKKRAASIKMGFKNGRKSWSKDLTKETDERVRLKGIASGLGLKRYYADDHTSWSKDLTKETDERLQQTSASMIDAYRKGRRVASMKGLTKETSEAVAAMAAALRLPVDEIRTRIEGPGVWRVVSSLDAYESTYDPVVVACTTCGLSFTRNIGRFIHGDRQPTCQRCTPVGSSAAERELADFVEHTLQLTIERNDKRVVSPLEVDIYIPSKRVAIEYNGLYWHSEAAGKKHYYHDRKSDRASNMTIRLMHVFEDEWRDKRPIIESMLRARLDVGMRRIDARKCTVAPVSKADSRAFFDANHIDAGTPCTNALGLYHDGELVQCISLRSPRQNVYRDANFVEVARLCPTLNTYVRGGVSRLSRHALKHVKSMGKQGLMTYVDRRLGGDASYSTAGWNTAGITKAPRYWWTDGEYRYDRFSTRADRSRGMSENDVAAEKGVTRISGCRNTIYTLT